MSAISAGGFGTPNDDDNRPWLWVVSVISCAYSVLTLGARIMSKIEVLSYEDLLLGAAYMFGLSHWGLFNRAVYIGFGARGETTKNETQLFLSSQTVLLIAIYLSKLSVLLLGRRIFSTGSLKRQRSFDVAIGVAATCGIASVILVSAQCDFRYALTSPAQRCENSQARWIAVQVLDALTELPVVILPICFTWRVTLMRSSKITVISLFALRLPCIIFLAMAVTEYRRTRQRISTQTSLDDESAIWFEVLLGYSLSSASFPCVRTFLVAFLADSKYRLHESTMRSHTQTSRSGGNGTENRMQSHVSATGHPRNSPANERVPGETDSVASDASQRMMIGRSVEIEVLTEAESRDNVLRWDTQHGSHDPFYHDRG